MNREHIILMADASGLSLYGMGKDRDQFIDYLECFADLIAFAEREACAKIVENEAYQYTSPVWAFEIVNDIRARGQA